MNSGPQTTRPSNRLGHSVIDMRYRPSLLHRVFDFEPGTAAFETVRWLKTRV